MSYIFAALIILGYLQIIFKYRIGFLVQMLGCLGMMYLYFGLDGGVILVNAVFLFVNLFGFLKWRKQGEVIMEGNEVLVD